MSQNAFIYALLGTVFALGVSVFEVTPAAAQVQVKTLDDGTRMIFNEPAAARQRRQAGQLLDVPSSSLGVLIDRYARLRGLSPKLVQAVIQVESGYNSRALSNKGAMGLMQLMPGTARELKVTDAYDPEDNIRGGTLYLRQMLQRFSGDLTLALAAYNAGPTAVSRYEGVPPYRETERYIEKVMGIYRGSSQASGLLQDYARTQAKKRERQAAQKAAKQRSGDPVFIHRDKDGRIVMTTRPN